MRFVSYNIQYGLGSDGRYDLERIAREAEGADVIALQEVDRFWQRSGNVDSPEVLAGHLRGYYWVYGANLDIHAATPDDPGRRRQFGTMLLSKTPILSSRNHLLPKWGTLSQHSIQQGILEGVIMTGSGPLRVYSVHLSHLCRETRLPQIDRIRQILKDAHGEGGAWCGGHPDPSAGWTEGDMPPMPREAIVMGDLNLTPSSDEYTALIGPWTEKYGRIAHRDGLVDSWTAAGHDEREGMTHPNGSRIDYILVSAALAGQVRAAGVMSDAKGSDHWPIWADIDL
ncbi:MAG: endonuclease/exonuclease/phosphatase family protein [Geminicoccaceae bacterium]|nr:endonuclease/exonuclease/phosphatase family protein [Geminicoccaceae bacterium]